MAFNFLADSCWCGVAGGGETEKKRKKLMDMDNSVVIASGEGRWKEVEEGKGGINGDGRRLDLGDEHNTVYR